MFIEHFNEQAQVHRYNCFNLLLRVSAVVFLADTFATRLGGTTVAKVICIRRHRTSVSRTKWAGVALFKLHWDQSKYTTLPFWSLTKLFENSLDPIFNSS